MSAHRDTVAGGSPDRLSSNTDFAPQSAAVPAHIASPETVPIPPPGPQASSSPTLDRTCLPGTASPADASAALQIHQKAARLPRTVAAIQIAPCIDPAS